MDTTKQIQRFPFKTLVKATGKGSDQAMPSSGFQAFPYKANQDSLANKKTYESPEKEKPKEPSISEKDLFEARQKSYEEGYAKGYNSAKSAEAEIENQIRASLSDITIKLAAIGEAVRTRNNEHIKELTGLVIRVARKVAGTALKNEPYSEIEKIIRDSLPLLFDEPKISIFVSPDLVKNIEERITSLAKSEGFKNNIEISGNPALSLGSCDIEWHGGGVRSSKDMVWNQIERLCESV